MPTDSSELDKVVSRTVRDNLGRLQGLNEELNAAIADLVSACGSNRSANALPAMLRAQASAASLAASLDVLAKFVTRALQPATDREEQTAPVLAVGVEQTARPAEPVRPTYATPTPMSAAGPHAAPQPMAPPPPPPVAVEPPATAQDFAPPQVADPSLEPPPIAEARVEPTLPETSEEFTISADLSESAGDSSAEVPGPITISLDPEAAAALAESTAQVTEEVTEQATEARFDLNSLPSGEQELHRRANRVAKVSMQDIKLLRPDQVRLGREHQDLCVRLRDDIEKAHKEYDRRFHTILGHPVDYFYHWMVEVLGDGDPKTLGEYPYSSPVLRR